MHGVPSSVRRYGDHLIGSIGLPTGSHRVQLLCGCMLVAARTATLYKVSVYEIQVLGSGFIYGVRNQQMIVV